LGRGHLIPHTRGRHTNLAQPAPDDGTLPLAPAPRLTNPQPDITTLDGARSGGYGRSLRGLKLRYGYANAGHSSRKVVAAHGFADHAHFTNEIGEMTGFTPTTLLAGQ
ncbi:MAG: hypothetical protein M3O70_08500, partial [Actinomycetota bacterium]|nr:hypothetical protein [Actinomycetota bacterium]